MKKAINQSTLFIIINTITAALMILAIVFVQLLAGAGVDYERATEERYNLTLNANRFMDGSAYLTNEVRAFAATGDIRHYDNYWNEIDNLKNRDIGVENMRAIGLTEEEEAEILAMAMLSNQLVPLEDLAMQMTMDGHQAEALEMVFGTDYELAIGQIRTHRAQLLFMLDERASNRTAEIRENQNTLTKTVQLSVIIVGLMQLVNVIVIMITTISPIKKLQKGVAEIARGNLSAKLDVRPDTSEIGMLTDSVLRISLRLWRTAIWMLLWI
jgi:methyl-accepting chemotaxis protein